MKVVTIHLVQYILIYDCDIDKYVKLMTCLKKEPSKQDTIKTTHVSIKNLDSTLRKWGNINWILCKFHYVRSNSLYLHFDMLLLTNYVTFTTIIGLIFDLPLTMCKFPLENNTNCVYDMTLLERDHLFTWSRMGKASLPLLKGNTTYISKLHCVISPLELVDLRLIDLCKRKKDMLINDFLTFFEVKVDIKRKTLIIMVW